MTPARKIGITIRQTGDQAIRISAWLAANGQRLGCGQAMLGDALASLSTELDSLQRALERPCAIAVVSTGGDGQASLVSRFIEQSQRGTDGDRRQIGGSAHALLAAGGQDSGGATAAVRFTSAPIPAAPDGMAFAIQLLGLADLAAIMVRTHFTLVEVAAVATPMPHGKRLREIFAEVAPRLAVAPAPGLQRRDVQDLREWLASSFPEAASLKMLDACGYWQELADVAPHLPLADRILVLSVLWSEQPDITLWFAKLAEALSRVSFETAAFCPRDAVLIPVEDASFRSSPHTTSILAVQALGADDAPQVRISTRFGQRVPLARSSVAALIAQITLPIDAPAFAPTPEAELIAFPTPPTVRVRASPSPSSVRAPVLAPATVEAFAHAKALHLFERSLRRHDFAALAVVVEPDADCDDALAPAVAEWIDRTHGSTPASRELSRTTMFVVATRLEESSGALDDDTWGDRLESTLSTTIGSGMPWTREWVPSQPFDNVHLYQHDDLPGRHGSRRPLGTNRASRQATAHGMVAGLTVLPGQPVRSAGECELLVREIAAADGGAERLSLRLGTLALPTERLAQLRRHVIDLRSGLRLRLARLTSGQDADEDMRWRRELAATIGHRMARLARSDGLGQLLAAFSIGEGELEALADPALSATHPGTFPPAVGLALPPPDHAATPRHGLSQLDPGLLARRAVCHWSMALHWRSRSARLARDVGLTPRVLEHLAGEIAVGAERLDLEGRFRTLLSDRLAEHQPSAPVRLFASCGSAMINGFLERLEFDTPSDTAAKRGQGRNRMAVQVGAGGTAVMPVAPLRRPLPTVWCESLGALIEANIEATRLKPDTDNELSGMMTSMLVDHAEASL